MLRSFRLANHRSFRDEHELLLMPSYDNDREVVPVAAVFGANASGKSNLLDGLQVMSSLVQGWERREPGSGIARSPFRLDPKSLLAPSSFAVELVLDGVRYDYGVVVDDERVVNEWLYSYPRGRRRVLFDRQGEDIDFGATVTQRTRAEVIEDLVTEDVPFIAMGARLKVDQLRPVTEWFRRALVFPRLRRSRPLEGERLARFIERSPSDHATFLELARAADVGISDLAVEFVEDPGAAKEAAMATDELARLEREATRAEGQTRDTLRRDLQFAQARAASLRERSRRARLLLDHGGAWFELKDESDGTRLWLEVLPSVITSLESGQTLVIDEIDSSLHPLLVRKLVGLFRDPSTNIGRAQLLFSTHDAFLLAPIAGEQGLERDQVWFVEKRADGASELFPLTDFKPRNEHNLARRYLGGAYGGVPMLDGFDGLDLSARAE